MSTTAVAQLLFSFVATVFLVFGLLAFAVGLGLIVSARGMSRLFSLTNRWISLRRPLRSLERVHDIRPMVGRYRRWFGAVFVAGAAFSVYGLLLQFRAETLASALRFELPGVVVAWLLESLRWLLVLGSLLALAVGFLLLFSPGMLDRIAAAADRWYSPRRAITRADRMHLALDLRVRQHPRAAGAIIAAAALFVVVNFAMLLFGGG